MVELYIDAGWAGELTDQRCTSRYCSYVWGNLVTWRSKKQSVVARSSIEYWVVDLEMFEGMWIQKAFERTKDKNSKSIQNTLWTDSQAVINIVRNLVHHDKMKHRDRLTFNIWEGQQEHNGTKLCCLAIKLSTFSPKLYQEEVLKNSIPSLDYILYTTQLEEGECKFIYNMLAFELVIYIF